MTSAIREMRPSDWGSVRRIYAEGLETGDASFEREPPSWEEWDRTHLDAPRLVAEDESGVIGWAALSPVSERCVYGGVAEVSVYVGVTARGRGVGLELLTGLAHASERAGIWTLQAGIFPENTASLGVHRAAGFREVGIRERIGQMDGRWRDVVLLERRSNRVGTDH